MSLLSSQAHVLVLVAIALSVLLPWKRITSSLQSLKPACLQLRRTEASRYVLTCLVCIFFLSVGPALMMLNKYIMQDLHFHYPIALCSLGLIASTVISHLAVMLRLAQIREESWRLVEGWAWFRVAGLIGLTRAITMSTGNAVYLHLSFGFIQMLKAFTPLFVLGGMRAMGVALPTRSALWCVVAIVAGTMVEVHGEMRATFLGLFLMISSEATEAVSVVLSQKLLQNNKFTVLEGMYITAPAGSICLVIGAAMSELPQMVREGHHLVPLESPWAFAWSAALGVAVNFSTFLVIQMTSSLTLKILNASRTVGLVVVGVLVYREYHPWFQLAGYALALAGFLGYNVFQLFPEVAQRVEDRVDRSVEDCRRCGGARKEINPDQVPALEEDDDTV